MKQTLMRKHIHFYMLLLSFFFIGKEAVPQLPHIEDICSQAKSGAVKERNALVDYLAHDAYDIHFYHLNLNVETENTFIKGKVIIHALSKSNAIDTLYLELADGLEVAQILINSLEAEFIHNQQGVLMVLNTQNIEMEEAFSIEIDYQGLAVADRGRGYVSADSYHETRVNWTLSEPFYAKDWWPCKQDLEDKADSVWVFVTTDQKNKVGSNGLLTASVPLENNKLRYEWKSNYPIAYYLVSIAVAEYMEYSFMSPSEEGDSVWMQNYLYPDSSMYKNQKAYIDCTMVQMNLLQEKYGSYPFIEEKYGHCITPIAGGMEHQTMTTQRNFHFHLTIHEMGHSWFGNAVTCATWNHIWINEGFATYTQYLGLENLANRERADGFMAAMQSRVMSEPDGSVFVPNAFLKDRDRIFSGRLSYYKGAVIIHMIRYLLDDDALFFHILQEFQRRYAYQTATAEDFRGVLEELSGHDFESFFDLWYYGEGYPIYHFNWKQSVNGKLVLISKQESSTPKTNFFPMKFHIQVFFKDGSDSIVQLEQNQPEEVFQMEFSRFIKEIIANPRSSNLMEVKSIYSGLLFPNEISIEPNPVGSACIIRFANVEKKRHLEIYNSSLQLIESHEAPNRNFYLQCDSWAKGIYFIKVKNDKYESLKKLVKY